jgi:hypothetical protein
MLLLLLLLFEPLWAVLHWQGVQLSSHHKISIGKPIDGVRAQDHLRGISTPGNRFKFRAPAPRLLSPSLLMRQQTVYTCHVPQQECGGWQYAVELHDNPWMCSNTIHSSSC